MAIEDMPSAETLYDLEHLTADGTCLHSGCPHNINELDPDKFVWRRLSGCDSLFLYCRDHDPLRDKSVKNHFEEAIPPEEYR
jgi:hypothetical protein